MKKYFSQAMTLLGVVEEVHPEDNYFSIRLRSDDLLGIYVSITTNFTVLTNLDGADRDRVPIPKDYNDSKISDRIRKYLQKGNALFVEGVYQEHEDHSQFEARKITLMHFNAGKYVFEEKHWWLTQISLMADEWLQDLFGDQRGYKETDFTALYRTNLSISGGPTDNNMQIMSTLSRFIYGLCSAYLLTGTERYLDAARAGVHFQRTSFRNLSHDDRYVFWSYGRKKLVNGAITIVPSQNPDDYNSIAIYEQIYALAGLAQFFRVTGDLTVLEDINRTVRVFDNFFLDEKSVDQTYPGMGGYFSHLDPATLRPDTLKDEKLNLRKNWNSIGDHIPAYLVNLLLALEPIPHKANDDIRNLVTRCKALLDRTVNLIVEKFSDPESIYVNERFHMDWTPDHDWKWQQNRGIIGHNLKIVWNLTRVACYYDTVNRQHDAKQLIALAEKIANAMKISGLDLVRGGCFDAVERKPKNRQPIEFAWYNTKDFWQQEQAILAYQILYGYTGKTEYCDLAHDCLAFWNQFFLDRHHRGIFFRTTENGMPVFEGTNEQKAGYSIAGYHAFELNYLAHIYMRTYFRNSSDETFCLYFKPVKQGGLESLNVLPDFTPPNRLSVEEVTIGGRKMKRLDDSGSQVILRQEDQGQKVIVRFSVR